MQKEDETMFFKLDKYDKTEEKLYIANGCELGCEGLQYEDFIRAAFAEIPSGGVGTPCTSVGFTPSFPKRIKEKIGTSLSDEAYAIEIGRCVRIYSRGQRGFIYAVMTLCQLAESDELY